MKKKPSMVGTGVLGGRKHRTITDFRFLRSWQYTFLSEVSPAFEIRNEERQNLGSPCLWATQDLWQPGRDLWSPFLWNDDGPTQGKVVVVPGS